MVCRQIKIGDASAFVCGPARRCRCGRPATKECDWKVPARKSGTCDAPLCDSCATAPAPEKDLCPRHAEEWRRRRGLSPLA